MNYDVRMLEDPTIRNNDWLLLPGIMVYRDEFYGTMVLYVQLSVPSILPTSLTGNLSEHRDINFR